MLSEESMITLRGIANSVECTRPSALNRQEGGDHYKKLKIQPAEYCHANGLGHMEGDAVAYITRWRSKGGLADLRKAIQSLEILIELEERAANA